MEKRVVSAMEDSFPGACLAFHCLAGQGPGNKAKVDVPAGDIAEHSVIVERMTDVIILA